MRKLRFPEGCGRHRRVIVANQWPAGHMWPTDVFWLAQHIFITERVANIFRYFLSLKKSKFPAQTVHVDVITISCD